MKLSEMSTRQAAECMADMVGAIGRIVKDAKVKEAFEKAVIAKKPYEQKLLLATELPPLLLRRHLNDTAKIVSVLMGKTPEEVLDQPIRQTIEDIVNSLDGELFDFFKSSGASEQAASSM